MLIFAGLSLVLWVVLLFGRGGFWRADQRLGVPPAPEAWPEIAVVIPARNEVETIAEVVAAHRATAYPGAVRVFVVDDSSDDGTAEAAREAGAEVVAAPPLAPGWTGKLWAVSSGVAAAEKAMPDLRWLLLTDADIVHAPETLQRLVAMGEARDLALVSLMARLDARGFWGRLLIPAFIFFFQKLYPFRWVNDPQRMMGGAAGGCMLVRAEALRGIGGIAAIRGALIDDCTLAARLKTGPPRRAIWLGLADGEMVSRRDNRPLGSIWTMVARSAFTQLDHSALQLLGTVLGMVLIYLAPPLAVAVGLLSQPMLLVLGLAAWALMLVAYRPTLRLYGLGAWHGLLLPLAGVLYTAMTVDSALQHWRGQGGRWKGRTYP
ncbi:MAG: glycosyltransferase [Pseudomonadota bacterium]